MCILYLLQIYIIFHNVVHIFKITFSKTYEIIRSEKDIHQYNFNT